MIRLAVLAGVAVVAGCSSTAPASAPASDTSTPVQTPTAGDDSSTGCAHIDADLATAATNGQQALDEIAGNNAPAALALIAQARAASEAALDALGVGDTDTAIYLSSYDILTDAANNTPVDPQALLDALTAATSAAEFTDVIATVEYTYEQRCGTPNGNTDQ